jgi:hypothetical protein
MLNYKIYWVLLFKKQTKFILSSLFYYQLHSSPILTSTIGQMMLPGDANRIAKARRLPRERACGIVRKFLAEGRRASSEVAPAVEAQQFC